MAQLTAMQTFIKNVQRIRLERGLTQGELAQLLGTKQPSVSRVLRGEEDITLSRAEKFAEALGVSLSELILEPEFSK